MVQEPPDDIRQVALFAPDMNQEVGDGLAMGLDTPSRIRLNLLLHVVGMLLGTLTI